GITNPNRIYAGKELVMPTTTNSPGTTTTTSYTVKAGDTLASIATKLGTTVTAIATANGITNPNRIYAGKELVMPTTTNSPGTTTTSYTVKAGDTLASIAAKLGTTVTAIATANGITDTNVVYVGTRLTIGTSVEPAVAPGATGSSGTYSVVAGDTMAGIAGRFGLTASQLASLNNLGDPNRIQVGQVLEVPGAAGFVCPVPGGDFFNDWGFPRSGGRYHEGTDIFATRGSSVLAPVDGFVHQIVGTVGGIQFRLDGDDGHRYIGTHMDGFGAAGKVRAGEVIGYVGDSGNAIGSRPHLHFEILIDRTANTNPYPYLTEACR
ncbi:MAG: LysM peptidoglycan-binding domain-containing M23 family metallopeptidase, partial [Acidimicrobiia bacterium]|nr:LysM peptidoglycan-binding domain-containing M23 family metallopeptidase [Acidimicrobiia bacterium]